MIKLTFEAETMSELFEDIGDFLMKSPVAAESPPEEEKKSKKEKVTKESKPAKTEVAQTPLDESNADKKVQDKEQTQELATDEPTGFVPTYKNVTDAIMEMVKVKGKAPTLAILKKYGAENAAQLKVENFTAVIMDLQEATTAKAA